MAARMKRFALALAACITVLAAWAAGVAFTEVRYAGDDGGPTVGPPQYAQMIWRSRKVTG